MVLGGRRSSQWAPWGAARRRGHQRVPLARIMTYLLRSGWGKRGTKRGGPAMAFHPRLENPREHFARGICWSPAPWRLPAV